MFCFSVNITLIVYQSERIRGNRLSQGYHAVLITLGYRCTYIQLTTDDKIIWNIVLVLVAIHPNSYTLLANSTDDNQLT